MSQLNTYKWRCYETCGHIQRNGNQMFDILNNIRQTFSCVTDCFRNKFAKKYLQLALKINIAIAAIAIAAIAGTFVEVKKYDGN